MQQAKPRAKLRSFLITYHIFSWCMHVHGITWWHEWVANYSLLHVITMMMMMFCVCMYGCFSFRKRAARWGIRLAILCSLPRTQPNRLKKQNTLTNMSDSWVHSTVAIYDRACVLIIAGWAADEGWSSGSCRCCEEDRWSKQMKLLMELDTRKQGAATEHCSAVLPNQFWVFMSDVGVSVVLFFHLGTFCMCPFCSSFVFRCILCVLWTTKISLINGVFLFYHYLFRASFQFPCICFHYFFFESDCNYLI